MFARVAGLGRTIVKDAPSTPRVLFLLLGTTRSHLVGRETVQFHTRNPLEHPMSAVRTPARDDAVDRNGHAEHSRVRRLTTETKASFKTTEFFAFVAVLVGILIAAGMVDESNAGGFGAKQAWLYVTILTVGYMVSRGLAKSGSQPALRRGPLLTEPSRTASPARRAGDALHLSPLPPQEHL